MRPIMTEIIKPKSKVVASDGFIDEIYKKEGEEEEVTMVFTKEELSPDSSLVVCSNNILDGATLKHRLNTSKFVQNAGVIDCYCMK